MARGKITFLPLCTLIILLLTSHTQGDERACAPTITQRLTGYAIMGNPQWEVTMWMGCHCDIYNLVVSCAFFGSTDPKTNPGIIQKYVENLCLINQGYPLYGYMAYKFTYAWHRVEMKPDLFELNCTNY
ncbi:Unknown protein [Striga hermonthica]|uniref:Uncharacterized protein n=1 Tax=Striga hermonthica TaxID=68872 RepID=A0A9N7MUL5_STRHE|nr:Unknown protein [Striga hermonthica]